MKATIVLLTVFWFSNISSAPLYVPAKDIRENANAYKLRLKSHVALVFDERDNEIIYSRNAEQIMPVASLSKLMTAMVILDSGISLESTIKINRKDKDRIRYSRSRLKYGMKFTRRDLLQITLAASENRAAMALARTYPGGSNKFVADMNLKAKQLGLKQTRFIDPAGLHDNNVSTANELIRIVRAASQYPLIKKFTTQKTGSVFDLRRNREIKYGNTNRLIRGKTWPITLSKTGYTSKAGNCLIMQTEINARPVIIVLLESWGKLSKYGDSNRIRRWLIKYENRLLKLRAKL